MDPLSGRVYDLSKDDIPADVRERLVPVDEAAFVAAQAQELGELIDVMEEIKTMPAAPPEKFYPINRAARRENERRNRALKKRKPRG